MVWVALLMVLGFAFAPLWAAEVGVPATGLILPGVPVGSPVDGVQKALFAGTFSAPKPGDQVAIDGKQPAQWKVLKANDKGIFTDESLGGGYLYLPVSSDSDQIAILEAAGDALVYVNGQLHSGDVYSTGYVHLPIDLKKGMNDLLFVVGRGQLSVKIVAPPAALYFNSADITAPDFIQGQADEQPLGAVLINASHEAQKVVSPFDGRECFIPPMAVRKIALPAKYDGQKVDKLPLKWTVAGATLSTELRVRDPQATYKNTFISQIDGSVQYYAVVPPIDKNSKTTWPLIMDLHGAQVEAIGLADAHEKNDFGYIICPTNRGPFGFDWEEWGRLDAMEVLADAQKRLKTDPQHVYLQGHSMGGHGAWQIGSMLPDRFAAVGVAAGWMSFESYNRAMQAAAAGKSDPSTNPSTAPTAAPATQAIEANSATVANIMARANAPGDMLQFVHNLAPLGVFILHGQKDGTVPVSEARNMARVLKTFHPGFGYHEEPGADHWFGRCVDWPGFYEMYRTHVRPLMADVKKIDFTTVNPTNSASYRWATIDAQIRAMAPSTIHLVCDSEHRTISGTTENVLRIAFDPAPLKGEGTDAKIILVGTVLQAPIAEDGRIWLQRTGQQWAAVSPPSPYVKNADRGGPFKSAFNHRVLFIYGTKGSAAENAWALNKARYDAELFYVRGNGSIDIIPDSEFDAKKEPDRSVVIYGNADVNSLWPSLLADSPIQIKRGQVTAGDMKFSGDDLSVLFLRPRDGSDVATVAVVAATGAVGQRVVERLPYLMPFSAFPDWTIISTPKGNQPHSAIRAAGFFDNQWQFDPSDSARATANK
jgi:pimeloyl-ACP methyl ester carboxylesterase